MTTRVFNMTREDKVNEFRRAGRKKNFEEAPDESKMILDLIKEELDEFLEVACEYVVRGSTLVTRANLCKEWADLQYVVSQAAVYFGIPADAAFNRVHENNLTKIPEDGIIKYREDGKILKPQGS